MPTLVLGNKNYSSWSLRPWLLMTQFGVTFDERVLPLDTPRFGSEIGALSPSRRVPVLHHDGLVVWDSLAICEYVNEVWLDGRGWPYDRALRAVTRSAVAEMHSGFAELRTQLPMNCSRTPDGYRWNERAQADIDRVQALWMELRDRGRNAGDFLCGAFGIVDAMFAPVVIRFIGYGVPLDAGAADYVEAMLALPSLQQWIRDGRAEAERIDKYEQLQG